MAPLRLSQVVSEEGPLACSTLERAVQAFSRADRIDEDRVSEAIVRMLNSIPNQEQKQWIAEHFVMAVKQFNDVFDWLKAFRCLDRHGFLIREARAFNLLVSLWDCSQRVNGFNEEFPTWMFTQPWSNRRGQLSVLRYLIQPSTRVFDPSQSPDMTSIITPDHILDLPVALRPAASRFSTLPLNCFEIIETLLSLIKTEVGEDVAILFDHLFLRFPELLLLGLSLIQPRESDLHHALLQKLLNMFLIGHENSSLVFILLWQMDPYLLMRAFLEMYKRNQTSVTRIFEIVNEAKILTEILYADLPLFVLDLASLAARRQHLNLRMWLSDQLLQRDAEDFPAACIQFLEEKCAYEVAMASRPHTTESASMNLAKGVWWTFFEVLLECNLNSTLSARLQSLMRIYEQLYPGQMLQNLDPNDLAGQVQKTNVEELARQYFERLYAGRMGVDQFVDILSKCRESRDIKQQELFSCTVHILLDEIRFMDQYPSDELADTARLLGLLIKYELVDYGLLRQALSHILFALNQPPASNSFRFGTIVITEFQNRLCEWPEYAEIISKKPGLEKYASIKQDHHAKPVWQRWKSLRPRVQPAFYSLDADSVSSKSSEANNNSDLVTFSTQNEVAFIINNFTETNFEDKTVRLEHLLDSQSARWFSHYLVTQRVATEPNNLALYARLLDRPKLRVVRDKTIKETYACIWKLLESEATVNSTEDRAKLKNLGSWLGLLTLARDKPISAAEIRLKQLLLDLYDQDLLILGIPLVCKILLQAKKSKTYNAENPWFMDIMRLLAELYWTIDLRLNLKFEIEILFKTSGMDLDVIERSTLLQNRSDLAQSEADELDDGRSETDSIHDMDSGDASQQGIQSDNDHCTSAEMELSAAELYAKLDFVDDKYHEVVKTCTLEAILDTLNKVVPPVSKAAAHSSAMLIIKDFATDLDKQKLKRSAYRMAQTLSNQLVGVYCGRSPVDLMVTTLNTKLIEHKVDEETADLIGSYFLSHNKMMITSFVEELTEKKATDLLEQMLQPSYATRWSYGKRENVRTCGPYFDMTSLHHAPHNFIVPDGRLRVNGSLNVQQMRLYETFKPIPVYDPQQFYGMEPKGSLTEVDEADQLEILMNELGQTSSEIRKARRPPARDHILCKTLEAGLEQATRLIDVPNLPPRVVQRVVNSATRFALTDTGGILLTAWADFLRDLVNKRPAVCDTLHEMLLKEDDNREYNLEATYYLLERHVIRLPDYDRKMSERVQARETRMVQYASVLIYMYSKHQSAAASITAFPLTVAALDSLPADEEHPKPTRLVIRSLYQQLVCGLDCAEHPFHIHLWLSQWVRLSASARDPIFQKLKRCVEADMATQYLVLHGSIEKALAAYNGRDAPIRYEPSLDAMMDLLVKLITVDAKRRPRLLLHTLTILSLLLKDAHDEARQRFDQRPFLRFLACLQSKLDYQDDHPLDWRIWSKYLYRMRPEELPGFTFAWLQLISSRQLIAQLLGPANRQGWVGYKHLIIALFDSLNHFSDMRWLADAAARTLYTSITRLTVVLSHDFPDFLAYYYLDLVRVIPLACVHLRNMILSAVPTVADQTQAPQLPPGWTRPNHGRKPHRNTSFEKALADYVRAYPGHGKDPVFEGIAQLATKNSFTNMGLMMLYAATLCEEQALENVPKSALAELVLYVLDHSDGEGLYYVINSLVDHLRFPSTHTSVFKNLLLWLYTTQGVRVQESIITVLLERLISHRPHPWGIQQVFMHISQMPAFWSDRIIAQYPEIGQLCHRLQSHP